MTDAQTIKRVLDGLVSIRIDVVLDMDGTGDATLGEATSLITELAAERDALAKFKAYVHHRLDDAGIPADPESPHKAQGCRIGGRLDVVFSERDRLLEACDKIDAYLMPSNRDSSVKEFRETIKSAKEGR